MTANSPISASARIALAALGLAVFFTMFSWTQSANPLESDPILSTDDMVRMITVRDWLAGQGWFDPVMPRLGVNGGTVMHWSRLIDLPIGTLVILGNAIGIDGERFAAIAWPFLTFVAAAAGALVAIGRASGSSNVIPAMIIAGFALSGSGVFDSGVIDHHNAQVALTLWLIAMITPGGRQERDLAVAGVVTSVMLAIGMEGLPLAIAGAIAVFVRMQTEGKAFIAGARAYGLALALSHFVLFFLLTGKANWALAHCDSFSIFHLVCAGIGGFTLWVGLHTRIRSYIPRPMLSVPVAAGVVVLCVAALLFPDCLGNPITRLDPRLREFWIDKVIETKSVFQVARLDPWLLPYMHILPLIALVFGTIDIVRHRPRSALNSVIIFVIISSAVTLFQMRGTQFAMPIAGVAISMLVTRYAANAGKERPVLLLGTLIFSCLFVWKILILTSMSFFSGEKTRPLNGGVGSENIAGCESVENMANLDQLPDGLVAAANSIGPAILYHTRQRVLAGPYHRNVVGNLAWINAMTAKASEAEAILKGAGVTTLALCPSDPDETMFSTAAPQGLASQLLKGDIPLWLEPVGTTMDKPLRLFTVRY